MSQCGRRSEEICGVPLKTLSSEEFPHFVLLIEGLPFVLPLRSLVVVFVSGRGFTICSMEGQVIQRLSWLQAVHSP